jgi:hypothetical protein
MKIKAKRFWTTMLICAVFGSGIGYITAQLNVPPLSVIFAHANLSGADWATVWVFIAMITLSGISAIITFLSRFSAKVSEGSGVVQLLGGGQRGKAVIIPLTLFYVGHTGILGLILFAKIGPLDTAWFPWIMGEGILSCILMVYGWQRCWALFDDLLRRIWIDGSAMAGFMCLLLGMVAVLASLSGAPFTLSGFHTIGAYHALYLVAYLWLMAKRAPSMLTDPLGEDV